ncbi:uncharacterized protein [Haliotis cracherodii]
MDARNQPATVPRTSHWQTTFAGPGQPHDNPAAIHATSQPFSLFTAIRESTNTGSTTPRLFTSEPQAQHLPDVALVSPSLRKSIQEDDQVPSTSSHCRTCSRNMSTSMSAHLTASPDLDVLWSQAVSKATRAVYRAGVQAFLTFMAMCGFVWQPRVLPPLSEDSLLLFVAHCHQRLHLRYTTIKSYLCGVRFTYLRHNVPNPWCSRNLLRVETIMKAIKKEQGVNPSVRLPITVDILQQIWITLEKGLFSPFTDLLMKTVCSVAFFGFLRCGEFTCDHFDAKFHLSLSSVVFRPDCTSFDLTLKSSKTDPFRRGITLSIHAVPTSYCPVRCLQEFIHHRRAMGAAQHDPLFVNEQNIPLTRSFFIQKLKHTLSMTGYDQEKYNGHSFRIGAATSASTANIPDHLIKTLGRWSSDCYVRYIRVPKSSIAQAQRAMAQNRGNCLS